MFCNGIYSHFRNFGSNLQLTVLSRPTLLPFHDVSFSTFVCAKIQAFQFQEIFRGLGLYRRTPTGGVDHLPDPCTPARPQAVGTSTRIKTPPTCSLTHESQIISLKLHFSASLVRTNKIYSVRKRYSCQRRTALRSTDRREFREIGLRHTP